MSWQRLRWCPGIGHEVQDRFELQRVHKGEELMHHDALTAVLEIGDRSSGEPELFGDGALGEPEFSATVCDGPTEATVEFHIRHFYKLARNSVSVKLTQDVYITNF